jgi:hypothetical protein
VTLNGSAATLSAGNYSASAALACGDNTLTAAAADVAGNSAAPETLVVTRSCSSGGGGGSPPPPPVTTTPTTTAPVTTPPPPVTTTPATPPAPPLTTPQLPTLYASSALSSFHSIAKGCGTQGKQTFSRGSSIPISYRLYADASHHHMLKQLPKQTIAKLLVERCPASKVVPRTGVSGLLHWSGKKGSGHYQPYLYFYNLSSKGLQSGVYWMQFTLYAADGKTVIVHSPTQYFMVK